MSRELVITLDEAVYQRLHERAGRDGMSRFIEDILRPHLLTPEDVEAGYRDLASDPERERAAAEWADALVGDAAP